MRANEIQARTSRMATFDKSKTTKNLSFRPILASDVDRAFKLESENYPADEAASQDKLQFRQKV